MPGPTLASEEALCWAAPNSVRTADFSASAFDFRIVAATWVCTLPAWAARRLLTMLIVSIRHPPSRARYRELVNECWRLIQFSHSIVIASPAEQSISPRKGRMDCFVASASPQEPVIVRLDRTIQYAAASRFCYRRLWNRGSPACAGGGDAW